MRTHIKICGITRVEDALLAATLGVDAIGLVFYPQSSRCLTIKQAQQIIAELPPFITTIGLFVDATVDEVEQILHQIPLDLLQFHGGEEPVFCQTFRCPYIKALRMQAQIDLPALVASYHTAQGLLLDAYHPQQRGGTGTMFDWQLIPKDLHKPLILAGGLNPANVRQAIRTVKPYGVDVSSGVESAPGIKDPEKLKAFVQEVQRVNCEEHFN